MFDFAASTIARGARSLSLASFDFWINSGHFILLIKIVYQTVMYNTANVGPNQSPLIPLSKTNTKSKEIGIPNAQ